jgi:hypothetical protein
VARAPRIADVARIRALVRLVASTDGGGQAGTVQGAGGVALLLLLTEEKAEREVRDDRQGHVGCDRWEGGLVRQCWAGLGDAKLGRLDLAGQAGL